MRTWRKMTWVLLACLALIACGEGEPQMEGGDAGREEEAAANQGELLPEPEPEQPLSVGDTATVLFGPLDEGAIGELKVTLTEVVDPYTPPVDETLGERPEATEGKRFVNLRLDIENTGDRPYLDALYGSDELILSDGEMADMTGLLGNSGCEHEDALNAQIPPGAKITEACSIFEVREEAEPARYVISDDEAVLAEWQLAESP